MPTDWEVLQAGPSQADYFLRPGTGGSVEASWTLEPPQLPFKGLTTLMPTITWPPLRSSLSSSSASASSADATMSASHKAIRHDD